MPNEKWRMDLKGDIRRALEQNGIQRLEVLEATLLATLPHLEAAYKRGETAGRSRAGYKVPRQREEGA